MDARHWYRVDGVGSLMIQADVSVPLARCFDHWCCAFPCLANRVTGDLALAEDMFQEVYLRPYHEFRQNIPAEDFNAWMPGVFRNDSSTARNHTHGVQAVPAQHFEQFSGDASVTNFNRFTGTAAPKNLQFGFKFILLNGHTWCSRYGVGVATRTAP